MSTVIRGFQPRLFGATCAVLTSAFALIACGSSTETFTAPSAIPRCGVRIEAPASTLPATGGTGSITVRTERECQWTAEPDAAWLSVTSGKSGQGDGTVQFGAAPNPDPVTRTGGIKLNDQRAGITQAAAECRFELGSTSAPFPSAGGAGTVEVRASSALCAWTATSSADWIAISAGATGRGSGTVAFSVAPTTGPERSGALTIAGLAFIVTQTAQQCTFQVAPLAHSVGASGGSRSVTITAGEGCAWTASSNVPWITITSGAGGSGPGAVAFTIAATSGPGRSGSVTVAGQTVTIVQGQGCAYSIAPESQSVPASGGNGSVTVSTSEGCSWTATSNAPWISVTSGANGSGNGTTSFSVGATNGPARSGTLTIAGRTFTVNQGQGCTFSLSSTSASAPASGATGAFEVRTTDGCGWSASSSASWLTITAGETGNATGTVRYAAAANTGPERTATITAGGQRFTVTQAAGCSYGVSPATHNAASSGATLTTNVTAPAGCTWTAASQAPWIGISSATNGSGDGTVQLAVAPNPEAERRGTVTIGGQTVTVIQASGCAFSISPAGQAMPTGGGAGSFTVNTPGTCAWTASANAPWISITAGAAGTGTGTVQFTVAPNTGAARSGAIAAAGQTFTVTQAPSCSATVTPDTLAAPAAGGSPTVAVATLPECSWTAASNAPWIAVASAASGAGNANVQLEVQANTGPARSGTVTIAGRTVTVNQDAGCTISISPTTVPVPLVGGAGVVSVTTSGGCTWTAASTVPWIAVTAGATGSGPGEVHFTVEANATGAARVGTITIGGQVLTVNQAGPGP